MENNQQNKSERNTSNNNGNTSFSNQQSGQQLPAKDEALLKTNPDEVPDRERHSESSKPDANEKLGKP
jgi:hypothetical protein